jgi:outer membrane autotransporter protein
MGSAAPIIASLETMHPDVSSGAMQGARTLNGHFLTAISNRLAFARSGFASGSGLSSGDMFQGMGFWMQGLGSHAKQWERGGIEGYTANTFGTSIGFDKLLNDHFRAGFAAGYGFGAINSKTPGSPSADIGSWQGTLYASYDSVNLGKARQQRKYSRTAVRNQAERLWYVDGMLAFTQNNYDSRREIFLGTEKRVAKADNHAQQYSTKFETGYTFLFEKTRDLEITPFVSLAYNYLYMNSYKEDGANALNLNVDGQGYNQLEQGLGLKFAYPMVSEKSGTFIPSIKGAWLFDYLADRFETSASFAGGGPAFQTYGVKPSRNAFLLGAELAFLNRKNMTLTGNFDWLIRDQYASYTYYLTLRFDF